MNKKKNQHPLVEKILSLVEFDPMYANMGMPDTKILYLSDESREIVRKEFEKYFTDSKKLVQAVIALVTLANALDDNNHTDLAVTILEFVATANEPLQQHNKQRTKADKK